MGCTLQAERNIGRSNNENPEATAKLKSKTFRIYYSLTSFHGSDMCAPYYLTKSNFKLG